MSQSVTTTIDPSIIDGAALATILNDNTAAFCSTNLGIARPSYLLQGGLWVDSSVGAQLTLYMYDGTTDRQILQVSI